MISIAPITLFKFDFGTSVNAIGKLGWTGGQPTQDEVSELRIPWQPLLPGQQLFSLLSWHTRISEFAGRASEMNRLEQWAESNYPVWVKFVIGQGGIGKSRLGAEFAERMRQNDWAAGFVDLRQAQAFPMKKAGTLLIIDYPEEHVSRVKELLIDLTQIGLKSRLRVLFLTRQPPEDWGEVISAANAMNVVDTNFLTLGRLDVSSATTVFNTTVTKAGTELQRESEAEVGKALIPEGAMAEWLKQAPENERALFIMAAAVHSAENPDEKVVQFSGREVVKALVEREVSRYQRIAENRLDKYKDKFALTRLLAMAAIADVLSIADIQKLSQSDLPVGFGPEADIKGELMTAGVLIDGKVHAPKPDIVAAAFAVDVLGRRAEYAPEILWAALESDIGGGLDRFGRLSYDTEFVLGIKQPRLSDWLAKAVEGNVDRCSFLEEHVREVQLPLGWLITAIAVYRTLLHQAEDEETRARFLNNLSNHSRAYGDIAGALMAIKEAVEIDRRLASTNPTRSEKELATDLNNLSICLSDTGDAAGALAAIQEAVEMYRRLAEVKPDRFEPDLAASLNNLSNHLNDTGDTFGALEASQESVAIRRRLADANPARFEHDLARSLNNLSDDLSATGNTAGALAAIQEAVSRYRRLSETNPARFEPDLAASLNTESSCLAETADRTGALAVAQEAVEICRRLAKANSARFEPDLAGSLNDLSSYLRGTGDTAEALAPIEEAVEIRRRLADANSARFEPDLAMSLQNLGLSFQNMQRWSEAVRSFKEAIVLIRPYAEKWPGSRHEELLKVLEVNLETVTRKLQPQSPTDAYD